MLHIINLNDILISHLFWQVNIHKERSDRSYQAYISNAKFINNTCGTAGGAIRITTINHTISNSTFEGNSVTFLGSSAGAVYLDQPQGTTAGDGQSIFNSIIRDSVFKRNKALSTGGALYVPDIYWKVTIDSTTFESNSVDNSSSSDDTQHSGK